MRYCSWLLCLRRCLCTASAFAAAFDFASAFDFNIGLGVYRCCHRLCAIALSFCAFAAASAFAAAFDFADTGLMWGGS